MTPKFAAKLGFFIWLIKMQKIDSLALKINNMAIARFLIEENL